jgi:hypothetical protein
MTIRRLMLARALLYDSIEDLRYNVVSIIWSSPFNIFLVTFPKPINTRNTTKMREITYCSQRGCIMLDMGCQILHTSCADINSSIDYNVTSFYIVREYSRNIKLPELLTEVIQGLCNFRLPRNFFIRNLLSES